MLDDHYSCMLTDELKKAIDEARKKFNMCKIYFLNQGASEPLQFQDAYEHALSLAIKEIEESVKANDKYHEAIQRQMSEMNTIKNKGIK